MRSEKIAAAFARPEFQEEVCAGKCRYSRAILDTYWNPGHDNNRPDLYAPTFRVDSFLFGNHAIPHDHDGNNAQEIYGSCENFDAYLDMIDTVIAAMKAGGCVALKSALAYDRALDFRAQSKRAAEKAFNVPLRSVAPEELKAFGDSSYSTTFARWQQSTTCLCRTIPALECWVGRTR